MLDTIPDDIQYDNTSLKIRWKDGKDCSYNLLQLRRKCPCAQCRGGHGPVANRQTDSIQQINLVSWKKVAIPPGRFTSKNVQFLPLTHLPDR